MRQYEERKRQAEMLASSRANTGRQRRQVLDDSMDGDSEVAADTGRQPRTRLRQTAGRGASGSNRGVSSQSQELSAPNNAGVSRRGR